MGGNPLFKVKQRLTEYLFQNKELISENHLNIFVNEVYKEYQEQKTLVILENEIKNLPYSLETALPSLKRLYDLFYQESYTFWQKENEIVKNLGGLFVLGTERHETRRIDNQLRGRAGRQGYATTSVSLHTQSMSPTRT